MPGGLQSRSAVEVFRWLVSALQWSCALAGANMYVCRSNCRCHYYCLPRPWGFVCRRLLTVPLASRRKIVALLPRLLLPPLQWTNLWSAILATGDRELGCFGGAESHSIFIIISIGISISNCICISIIGCSKGDKKGVSTVFQQRQRQL